LNKTFSEICIKCHECCKWMTFIVEANDYNMRRRYTNFYRARGCDVKEAGSSLIIMVNTPCPHLLPTGACIIYEKRPEICRDYDGRFDPNMRDRCQLPKE